MRQVLSHQIARHSSTEFLQSTRHTTASAVPRAESRVRTSAIVVRNLCLILLACVAMLTPSFAQTVVPTSRGDNARTGADTTETLLTPANVNKNSFGHLFSFPIDYFILAQPLYVPNVNIPGQGVHNVVYVVTLADSVYAIDADNGTQLWYASMLDGGTTASGTNLPCQYVGYHQEGIAGTPAIDLNTNTMYLVAKTMLNGVVRHDLHALDITTGNEQPGSPVQITAQTTSSLGHVTTFTSLHQKNRPGLLLQNGVVYIGFGSNGCNDSNSGWVLSYDASSLAQLAVFNTSPDQGLTSIWQAGNGLAADEFGNIYPETAEAGNNNFDIQNGGQTYNNSVLKLGPDLTLTDYFTPYDVTTLNSKDFDLSSTGSLVLPDLNGPYPHELIAGGKQGYVYVLNRDNLGMYSFGADQILQEIALEPLATGAVLFGSPAYWNNTVYFAPNGSPLRAFPLLPSGLLGTQLKTKQNYNGAHAPSISANGNTNGVLWVITGQLLAFDATTLAPLYSTAQAANKRDLLPALPHFVTQTVADGKVYVGTQTTLEAYGLFESVTVTSGNGQTGTVGMQLTAPIQIHAANPYTGQLAVGTTVNFTDGCKTATTCGSFNPKSAVTDANGNASTTYTLPQKAGLYTITFSGIGFSNATATATAVAGPATKLISYGGGSQKDATGATLGVTPGTKPLISEAEDAYKNPVNGVTIYFTATKNAIPNPAYSVTGTNGMAAGLASTTLQLPATAGSIVVTACLSSPCVTGSVKNTFPATAVAPITTKITVTSGNGQSSAAGAQLSQVLSVMVADQFGNPISGNKVTFSDNGAGGTFSNGSSVVTDATGTASQNYTLPTTAKAITINATATGIATPAAFSETSVAGPAVNLAISGGNNQTAPNGTQLPQALAVLVTDQYNNPVSGISVSFSDGGSGGIFSNANPVSTGANGIASQLYTLPPIGGATISITAAANGVGSSVGFTENSQ
jgi:outer membrane protein assembly factor BamB